MTRPDSTALHNPVLLNEVIEHFPLREGKMFGLDGTFGRGGHSYALLKQFPQLVMLAMDQDQQAIDYAEKTYPDFISSGRLHLFKGNFESSAQVVSEAKSKLQMQALDFILPLRMLL